MNVILTVDSEAGATLIAAQVVDSPALVDSSNFEATVNEGQRRAVLPHLDLNALGVLQLLAVECPGDVRLWVSSKASLKLAPHPLLDTDFLDFSDKFRGLDRS